MVRYEGSERRVTGVGEQRERAVLRLAGLHEWVFADDCAIVAPPPVPAPSPVAERERQRADDLPVSPKRGWSGFRSGGEDA